MEDVFGNDFPDTTDGNQPGEKRKFEDLDEEEEEDDEVFGQNKGKNKLEENGPGATTGMILSLRESVQNYKDKLATCQADLEAQRSEVQKWCSSFENGPFIPAGSNPEPALVVNSLRSLKVSEESLREQLEKVKKTEAAFIVALAKKEQEISDLKSALRDLKVQLKPSSIQAGRLLLDPSIHEEFTRLKNLNEEKVECVMSHMTYVMKFCCSAHQPMNGDGENVEKRKRCPEEEEGVMEGVMEEGVMEEGVMEEGVMEEGVMEEEEDEEERIKKFCDLLGRIREMKEIFQKKGFTTRQEMEDFRLDGNNNKRRKIEESEIGIEVQQQQPEEADDNRSSVQGSLNLNLGLRL